MRRLVVALAVIVGLLALEQPAVAASTLKDPDRVRYRSSNDTYCFSRLIYLVNKRTGQVVDRYYPNVIVARGTKNIITAYPSSSQCA